MGGRKFPVAFLARPWLCVRTMDLKRLMPPASGNLTRWTCGVVVGFMTLTGLAPAEEKAPPSPEELAWIEEITHLPPGGHCDLRPVRIEFGLSWNNVFNAGELAVSVEDAPGPDEDFWIGRAEGRSNGLARALWPYDVEAESRFDPDSLRPEVFQLFETERDQRYRYRLEFDPGKVRTSTLVLPKKGEAIPSENAPKESTYRYEFVQDILSTALYLRSHPLAEGDRLKLIVSPFNRPYYAEFESMGAEVRKVKGEKFDTTRLAVTIRKINFDRTLQDYDKMKKATIWLSNDDFRLPVEIHADIFVGFVSARALHRQWLDEASPAKAKAKTAGGLMRFLRKSPE